MTLEGLPDYIRTEWKEHGCTEFNFLKNAYLTQSTYPGLRNKNVVPRNNIIDNGLDDTDSANFSDEQESNKSCETNSKTQSPITYSVKCYFSTLNIWEYKNCQKSEVSSSYNYPVSEEKVQNDTSYVLEDYSNELFDKFDIEVNKISLPKQKAIPSCDSRLNKSFSEVEKNVEYEVGNQKNVAIKSPNKDLLATVSVKGCKSFSKSSLKTYGAGVAWALQYFQEQSETKITETNEFEEKDINLKNKVICSNIKSEGFNYENIHNNDLLQTEKRSLLMEIPLLLQSLYTISRDSIIQIVIIFAAAAASFTKSIGAMLLQGNSETKESHDQSVEQKWIQELNRMEVKALRCFKKNFGHLVKIFPRIPLLNENHEASLSKVVTYSDNYFQYTRERRDELINVSYAPPSGYSSFYDNVTEDCNVMDCEKSKGLFVTYLSEEEVQNILDNQLREKLALNDFILTDHLHSGSQEPLEDIYLEDNFKGTEKDSKFEENFLLKKKPTRTIFDEEGNPIKEINSEDREDTNTDVFPILKSEVNFEEEDNLIKDLNLKNEQNSKIDLTSLMKDDLPSKIVFDEDGNPIEEIILKDQEPFHKMVYSAVQNFQLIRFSLDTPLNMEIPDEIPISVRSYWLQRHRLFLRYDDGICLDEESWYSVTPEMIAAHQAQRCACDTVIDAFCGAGGNAIQLTAFCNRVIAIDIDPKKIELARNNAKVYGVAERIEFIVGDFFELAPKLKADVVFLSPPWGGIKYTKKITYDVYKLDGTIDCKKLFNAAMGITHDIALYLPKSANIFQVAHLAGPDGRVDIEYAHISNKRKGLTAYYGDLVDFSLSEEYDY